MSLSFVRFLPLATVAVGLGGCSCLSGLDDLDPENYRGGSAGSAPGGTSGGGHGGTGGAAQGGNGGAVEGGAGGAGGTGGAGGATGWCAEELFANTQGACVRRFDGSVACWGYGDTYIGLCSGPTYLTTPEEVPALTDVAELDAYSRTCTRIGTADLVCVGSNSNCEVTPDPFLNEVCPGVSVIVPEPVVSIAAAAQAVCAVGAGEVWCWGNGLSDYGFKLGMEVCEEPTQIVALGSDNEQVEAGYGFMCARKTNGQVWCWGRNDGGQLGRDDQLPQLVPVQVLIPPVVDLDLGDSFGIARTAAGVIHCWGGGDTQARQCGGTTHPSAPEPVTGLAGTYVEMSADGDASCAVRDDRQLVCWGSNYFHQTSSELTSASTPNEIQLEGSPFLVVDNDGMFGRVVETTSATCAIHESGEVYCWGLNEFNNPRGGVGCLATGSLETEVVSPEQVLLACP